MNATRRRSARRPGPGPKPTGSLRIIAGQCRGRKLMVPAGMHVRPTPDRAREALFSILGPRLDGSRVLDACAGTGALGLEALSRGASSALLVEQDEAVAAVVRQNVTACRLAGAEVVTRDVLMHLPFLAEKGAVFDIVFVDPPYGRGLETRIAQAVAAHRLLAQGAVVVIEHAAAQEPEQEHMGGLMLVDQRTYGQVVLAIWESE